MDGDPSGDPAESKGADASRSGVVLVARIARAGCGESSASRIPCAQRQLTIVLHGLSQH